MATWGLVYVEHRKSENKYKKRLQLTNKAYKTMVQSVVLYASEVWTLGQIEKRILSILYNNIHTPSLDYPIIVYQSVLKGQI